MTRPGGWSPVDAGAAAYVVSWAGLATPDELQREITRLLREQRAAAARCEFHHAQVLGWRAGVLRQELARRGQNSGPPRAA